MNAKRASPEPPKPVRRAKFSLREAVLTPEEFSNAMREALGGVGWQGVFARGVGISPSTVTRYMHGILPIPPHIGIIVEMLQTIRRHGLAVPDRFAADKAERVN